MNDDVHTLTGGGRGTVVLLRRCDERNGALERVYDWCAAASLVCHLQFPDGDATTA